MKKYLIIGIIFLAICFGVVIGAEIKEKNIQYTNLHDITNTGSKIEGVYVTIDATYVAGSITGDDNYSYFS